MKVQNFNGFMKNRSKINEQMEGFGANPEDDELSDVDPNGEFDDNEEGDEGEGAEPLTIEDLQAMIEDLTERVAMLENPGGEGDAEGEEGEDDAEGEGDTEEEEEDEA